MATQILLKRGLEADRTSFTPAQGEPIYTTDSKRLYLGDGTTPGGVLASGGGLGGEVYEASSNYTALPDQIVFCDTYTIGSFTITLPSNPDEGDAVAILDVMGSFQTNNLIVNGNGKKIDGYNEDFICDVNGAYIVFWYDQTADSWLIDIGGKTIIGSGSGDIPDLRLDANLIDDTSYTGITIKSVAGTNINFGQLCYRGNDGKMYISSSDSTATMPCLYIASENMATGENKTFIQNGYIRNNSWSLNTGEILYASTNGSFTNTPPSNTGDQVQPIGIAYSSNILFFRPDLTMIEVK